MYLCKCVCEKSWGDWRIDCHCLQDCHQWTAPQFCTSSLDYCSATRVIQAESSSMWHSYAWWLQCGRRDMLPRHSLIGPLLAGHTWLCTAPFSSCPGWQFRLHLDSKVLMLTFIVAFTTASNHCAIDHCPHSMVSLLYAQNLSYISLSTWAWSSCLYVLRFTQVCMGIWLLL